MIFDRIFSFTLIAKTPYTRFTAEAEGCVYYMPDGDGFEIENLTVKLNPDLLKFLVAFSEDSDLRLYTHGCTSSEFFINTDNMRINGGKLVIETTPALDSTLAELLQQAEAA